MPKKNETKVLRDIEEKLIDALKGVDTVGFAAQKIGIKTKTAYNILYRLRKKYVKARRFVNTIDAQKKHRLVRMVLTDRMQAAEPEPEPEEELLDALSRIRSQSSMELSIYQRNPSSVDANKCQC